ncbi:PIN domain-containing protein [Acinetobacter sp. ANC 3791]|uniref:PIN domain-containing protein n=1 Tax=Acinetobacter sp. ANC 3791 TaxID=2529836 RepID=UPI00103FF0E3|nr:PIN domain-containing protein [Acinetobacter sp. ANC 3791]TCB83469.1 hypothetical protein E0H90_12140 [Acinetobacter sp. ANC 3791]
MLTKYAEAISKFKAEPATILYLDTCFLLDIIRTPIRENITTNSIPYAKLLIELASTTPKSLWLVTSNIVKQEWLEHVDETVKEAELDIVKSELKRQRILTIAKAITDADYIHGQDNRRVNLPQKLKSLSEAVLNKCIIIPPEDAHHLSAMKRVMNYLPPSQRGKSEPKDCMIYELFLSICNDLNSLSFDFIFASSNTQDYGEKNNGGIGSELSQFNARYANNWDLAYAILERRT